MSRDNGLVPLDKYSDILENGNWSDRDNVFLDSEVFITAATLVYNDFYFYCSEGLRNKSKY